MTTDALDRHLQAPTPRESELLGHVRKLRSALWEQLRRPSIETRANAFTILDATRGDFQELPEDQPELWLDTNTIEQCAHFLEDVALERVDPSKGDPNEPIPEHIDPETLRWTANLMREQLPDITGPSIETMRKFALGMIVAGDKRGTR
jgi:hypothetical protein